MRNDWLAALPADTAVVQRRHGLGRLKGACPSLRCPQPRPRLAAAPTHPVPPSPMLPRPLSEDLDLQAQVEIAPASIAGKNRSREPMGKRQGCPIAHRQAKVASGWPEQAADQGLFGAEGTNIQVQGREGSANDLFLPTPLGQLGDDLRHVDRRQGRAREASGNRSCTRFGEQHGQHR